jgi:hypothetical protein
VDLDQCQNVAYGGCQASGKTVAEVGLCRRAFREGYKNCSVKKFQDFFNSKCWGLWPCMGELGRPR